MRTASGRGRGPRGIEKVGWKRRAGGKGLQTEGWKRTVEKEG